MTFQIEIFTFVKFIINLLFCKYSLILYNLLGNVIFKSLIDSILVYTFGQSISNNDALGNLFEKSVIAPHPSFTMNVFSQETSPFLTMENKGRNK